MKEWIYSLEGQVVGYCKHGEEYPGRIKRGKIVQQLRKYWSFTKGLISR